MIIPEEKVAEVRERTDLRALIGEHVELKRAGSSLKGLCPFHSEKTPSFHVHPDRGFFHCFGCQASGDAISFVMRLEGYSFPEAVRSLAERAGVEITEADSEEQRASRRRRAERERLLAVLDASAGFFVDSLRSHELGPMAWAELERRSIGKEAVERYRLGYAPSEWDGLARYLAGRGFSPADAEKVGVLVPRRRGDGYYDRFRHRLMFPIADAQGRIVAFSGRALEPVEDPSKEGREPPAKYVNSPETPLYTKGRLLFGLHEARVALRREDLALMCEGNFDVVALSQAGFPYVVAPLGTAFTGDQARLLRRFVSTVVLVFDADAAGRKASRAAWPLLAEVGVNARVVQLPPGDDPDSFLRSRGADAMRRLVDSAPPLVRWLIDGSALEAGSDPHAKAQAIEELGPVLAALDSPVEARLYVEVVAKAFEVPDIEVVRQQLRRGVRASRGRRRRPDPTSGPSASVEPEPRPGSPLPEIEKRLVGAFLDQPSLHTTEESERVVKLLTSEDLRAILTLSSRWAGTRGIDAAALLEGIPEQVEEPQRTVVRNWLERRLAIQEFEDEASALQFIARCASTLKKRKVARDVKRLGREVLAARRAGDDERAEALTRKLQSARRETN